jgi:5-methyltetrahydrofolate--homocysteine methyltransferase
MNPFLKKLTESHIMVADGATGTSLQRMGLKVGVIPEELVLDDPELLFKLASSFVKAGSDIILTCTFGGTSLRMKDSRYLNRIDEINIRAAEIARKASSLGNEVIVAGSVGPTGLMLQPYGPTTPEEMSISFTSQIKALVKGSVDMFVIETMFSMEEAALAFDAAKNNSDLPIVVSFSYDRGTRTMMGVKPTQVMEVFADKGASAIGANCGTDLENMEKVLLEYSTARPGFPLWAKPNAGLPRMDENNYVVYDVTPEQMGESALRNIELGARIVGGCCGSLPEHVAGIAKAVKSPKISA